MDKQDLSLLFGISLLSGSLISGGYFLGRHSSHLTGFQEGRTAERQALTEALTQNIEAAYYAGKTDGEKSKSCYEGRP